MPSHGDFSPTARAAAAHKEHAAGVIAEHAELIVAALPDVPDGHVLVAVVGPNRNFAGTHHVAQDDLVERVPELEGAGGVAMVFASAADEAAVRRRAAEMADIARKRGAAIDRITARRDADGG